MTPERQSAASAAREWVGRNADMLAPWRHDAAANSLESLLDARERPLLEQVAALRDAAARFLDVQQKWHGAKSEDEVRYWDSVGPETHDQLKRAIASTESAAREHDQRVRDSALTAAEDIAQAQFVYWRDAESIEGSGAAANIASGIAKLRARSQTEGA